MKRISKIYAVIMALVASILMALPVSAAAEAGKETPTVSLATASKKVSISKCKITVAKTATYTGKAIKPKVTVKYGKKTLKSGKHYKITYSSNKSIGTAKIKITGIEKNGYTGSKTVSFKIVPKKPTLTVKSSTATTVNLSWKKVSGAKNYIVYRYDSAKKKYVKLGTTTKTTYTAKKLTSAKSYSFAVKAYAKKNFVSDYSAKKSTYTRPAAVKNLVATPAIDSAILSWSKVTGATGYIIYEIENGKYTKLASTKALSYAISDLSEDTDYAYAVAAYVSKTSYLGEKTDVEFTTPSTTPSSPSSPSTPTTPSDPSNPLVPGKVENLSVVIKNGKAVLTWDKDALADGYTVYLYNSVTGDYTELDTFEGRETYSYAVTDGLYSFVVAAYLTVDDFSVYGDYSDVASVGLPFKAVENLRALSSNTPSVTLTWSGKDNAEGYDVYAYNAETKEYTFLFDAGNATTADVSGVEKEKVYTYAVNAYFHQDGVKVSGEYSAPASAYTAFGTKTSLKATAASATEISLKWSAVQGSTSYNIYKMNTETGEYDLVDNTAYRTYNVKDLSADTNYKFAVTAVREVDGYYFESIMTETAEVKYTFNQPANLKKVYDMFYSGTFGISYTVASSDGQNLPIETYLRNNKDVVLIAKMSAEGINIEAKSIYLDGDDKGYIFMNTSLGNYYTELSKDDLDKEGLNAKTFINTMAPEANTSIPYTVSTKEYNGKLCSCEEYVSKSGIIVGYYFYNNTLIAVEETSPSGSSSILSIDSYTASPSNDKFSLPKKVLGTFFGYIKVEA